MARCEFCEKSRLALWRGGHFGSLRGPSLWHGANFVHAVGWRCDAVAILDRYVVLRCGVVPVLSRPPSDLSSPDGTEILPAPCIPLQHTHWLPSKLQPKHGA